MMQMRVFLQLVLIMTNAFGSWFNVFFLMFRRLTSPGVMATATRSLTRTFEIEPCSSDYVLLSGFLWRKGCSLLMLSISVSCCLKQSLFIVKRCLMS